MDDGKLEIIVNVCVTVALCTVLCVFGYFAGRSQGRQIGRHEGEAMGYTLATGDMLGAFNGDTAATTRLDHELPGIGMAFQKYLAWVDRPVNNPPRHIQPKGKHRG